jgi:ubiquinone/menaquinone biosynthesis C-methylase UbiE
MVIWLHTIEQNYSVNPVIFAVLYFGTFIPCWYYVFKIIWALKNREVNRLLWYFSVELFLLALPYLYVLIWGRNLPFWVYIVLILLIILSSITVFRKINEKMDKAKSQKFWDWYAIIGYDLRTRIRISLYKEKILDIIKKLHLENNSYVLDAGCGTGYLIKTIEEKQPSVQIEAIDYSRSMLDRAAKRCEGLKNINFRQVDLNKRLPYSSNTFDAITCDNVLYAVPRPNFTLKEFLRLLKPKGRLVVVTPKLKIDVKAIVFHQLGSLNSFWQKLIAFLKIMIIYVLIMPFEISIDKKIKKGIYHSLTGKQVLKMSKKIGFTKGKMDLTFADQNWIISTQK